MQDTAMAFDSLQELKVRPERDGRMKSAQRPVTNHRNACTPIEVLREQAGVLKYMLA